MNRRMFAAIAMAMIFTAGAAVAQGQPPQQRPPAQQQPGHQPGPGHQQGPGHDAGRPGEWDKPAARKGSRWDRHVRACKARYRSYDVKRDAYRLRGAWVRCKL
jgi:hypothetical protein